MSKEEKTEIVHFLILIYNLILGFLVLSNSFEFKYDWATGYFVTLSLPIALLTHIIVLSVHYSRKEKKADLHLAWAIIFGAYALVLSAALFTRN